MYNRDVTANRLYEARKGKDLKQSDLSTALGITQPSYSDIETGKRDMTAAELCIIADILGVTVTWLLGEKIIPDLTDKECLMLENIIMHIKKLRNK